MELFDSVNDINFKFVDTALSILAHFRTNPPSDLDVWEEARMSESVPHFGNIYMDLLGRFIEGAIDWADDKYSYNFSYHVNSLDSHLMVNGYIVTSLEELFMFRTENEDGA